MKKFAAREEEEEEEEEEIELVRDG